MQFVFFVNKKSRVGRDIPLPCSFDLRIDGAFQNGTPLVGWVESVEGAIGRSRL